MLHHALILSSHREYAQSMRQGLLKLGDSRTRVDVETDALRAMQLRPHEYELILLDAMLHTMDGLQLMQFIKAQAPLGKFIVVSDSADETSRALAYQSGADFFLQRPTSPETLTVALEAIKGLVKPRPVQPPMAEPREGPVNLADLIQTHCLSGDSVLLLVSNNAQSGDVFIYRGELYHAQYPGRGGEGALREMLRWSGGRVMTRTIKLTQPPPRTIELSYRQLTATDPAVESGKLFIVPPEPPAAPKPSVVQEAPPIENPEPTAFSTTELHPKGDTELPPLNSHWLVNLSGDLLEGSQVAEPDRCAFITTFIYRKMADVAVALEVDYFERMTLYGPHLQQVLVADNLGVRHGVFDKAWTTEEQRTQYVNWCREQSL
jgi:DNA-binding response OmpR family regulator